VTRQGDEAVVGPWVDGDRCGAETRDEPVHESVAVGIGLRQRGQEPGRALEQVRARVIRAPGL
jgi:hypothetical protein